MLKILLVLILITIITGCTATKNFLSPAETASGYTYIPVDPFAIVTIPGANCPQKNDFLTALQYFCQNEKSNEAVKKITTAIEKLEKNLVTGLPRFH